MNTALLFLALALSASITPFARAAATTAQPAITLATLEYPPFCQRQRPDGGALVSIVREAFAQEDIPVNVIVMPWQRVVALNQYGRFDGVIGLWRSDQKSMQLQPGNPVFQSLIGAYIVQGKAPLPLAAGWLTSRLAGTVAGYHYPESIIKLKLNQDDTRDDETNLRKLQQRRVQFAMTEKAVGDTLIRSGKLPSRPQLAWGELVLAKEVVSVGFAPSAMQSFWRDAFNRGLWKLHQNGRYHQITTEYQLQEFAMPPQQP
ncbi:transporter substrate-binding domain-containing protein [Vogesella sp. DC21W]|uniref:Transporter substrate-binding domain-containing protein n=1 Tax=Vogesella aquatica TaxID=2984206 RepID=A0ABT5ITZ9_9NEIS|nr:transporter substrate-binding domain-containing protein [Vogesella aquatica]MDC7716050.1 transporter substrate-binding domain-containing protein [Vogesella aquatica]